MSTLFEKMIAKRELERRRIKNVEAEEERIKHLPTSELERIIAEKIDVEVKQETKEG